MLSRYQVEVAQTSNPAGKGSRRDKKGAWPLRTSDADLRRRRRVNLRSGRQVRVTTVLAVFPLPPPSYSSDKHRPD